MQLLARFQIELVDQPGDRKRRRRTQRLGHGPQRFVAMRGLDQNKTGRIETKAVEAVAGKPAMAAPPMGRQDENERMNARQTRQHRDDETEGGRQRAFRPGHDLMQGAGGQAAVRQVGINGGEIERQGLGQHLRPGRPGRPGDEAAQLLHDCGARKWNGKCIYPKHLAVSRDRDKSLDVRCMFQPSILEQIENIAKREQEGNCLRRRWRAANELWRLALLFGAGRLNWRRENHHFQAAICRGRPDGGAVSRRSGEPGRHLWGRKVVRRDQ